MRTLHGALLAALLAAEMLLFLEITHHYYAWSYPRWNDQVQYLGQSYGTYEKARADGYCAAAWNGLTEISAQGCLHEVLTLPIFTVFGASRTSALAVNMLAFAALQLATFLAMRRVSLNYSMAWASIGILLALQFPWSGAVGSAVDFRLDWMAACAFGVTLAVAIAGRGFRSTGWAPLMGAAVGATVLLRFLTAVYFALIFIALLIWLLTRRDGWGRCIRLALASLVAIGICGPALWNSRSAIYSYYWLDHVAGAGRAAHDSHFGAIDSLRWIVTQVIYYKVGLRALILGMLGTGLLVAASSGSLPRNAAPGRKGAPGEDGAGVMALVFLLAPAAVLASFPIKDQPPASILIPGAVWIVFLVWSRLVQGVGKGAAAAIGAGVLAGGMVVFVRAETATTYVDHEAADYRAINGLDDYLFFRSETVGLAHPRLGVAWLLNGIDAETLRILSYERHHRMLGFTPTLPTGLFATSSASAMDALSRSDFVCLTTRAGVRWPFDAQMGEMRPQMREWCESHMTNVGKLDTADSTILVFERKAFGAMPGAQNGDLASLTEASARGAAYGEGQVPSAPIFVSQPLAVASTVGDFRFRVVAAITPVTYHAAGMPAGVSIDSQTGEIRGRFPRAGDFFADVRATNSKGTTTGKLEFRVEDGDWFAFLSAPRSCQAGVAFEVRFGAFDSSRTLDFIDVTDLTARRTLERMAATDDQRQSWAAVHRLVLSEPGPHIILMRFARYDPNAREPYSFVDHQCEVDVSR